jgi:apolipoprotein N-acyltransferase
VHNSIIALGEGSGLYHKQRLVPFGEYVPLEQWLRGLIRFLDMPMSNFSAGAPGQPPLRAAGLSLGPLICYEVVYPDLVAEWLPHSDVLITISNDAWFGRSIGPLQHLQMAQMRALEAGRPMIRGTGNGVTALIDHRGRITAQAPQFERTTLTGTVQPMQGATLFARTGAWPSIVIALLLVAAGWTGRPKR